MKLRFDDGSHERCAFLSSFQHSLAIVKRYAHVQPALPLGAVYDKDVYMLVKVPEKKIELITERTERNGRAPCELVMCIDEKHRRLASYNKVSRELVIQAF